MALIRRRPRVEVRIPSRIRAGEPFVAQIILHAKSPVPVDGIDATLEGEESSRFGQQNQAQVFRRQLLRLQARIMDEGKLPEGATTFQCRFDLPSDLPPSYRGYASTCEYTLTVHASIPWWPDRVAPFDIVVAAPGVEAPRGTAGTYGSHPDGPKGDELTVECSIADRVLEPKGILEGAIALGNVAFHRVNRVSLSLVGVEVVHNPKRSRRDVNDARRFTMELAIPPDIIDGQSIPFRMRLPERMDPSFKSVLWELIWVLDVQAHVSWGRDVKLRIPLLAIPPGSVTVKERSALPIIGSERMQAVWRGVAQSLGLRLEGDCLRGSAGDTQVEVRREHRGGDGVYLIGELSYPSLHLGLDGGASSGFRRILGGGVSVGDARWDKRHYLSGRHPEQVQSMLRALGPPLVAADLHDIDDEHAIIQSREAGLTLEPLRRFAANALALAVALNEARQRIPPPPPMADCVEAWSLVAARLDGKLETARMAVFGSVEGNTIEIVTTWGSDGRPESTRLRTSPNIPPRAEQQLVWSNGRFTSGGVEGLPESCRSVVDRVLEGALGFHIQERDIALVLPAPIREASVLIDAARDLRAVAEGLRVGAGPYR